MNNKDEHHTTRKTSFSKPGRLISWNGRLENIASRPFQISVLLLLSSLTICIGGAAFTGIPYPSLHDEFSYLLASDTFASGRITNPTHPFWHHFETMHVLHHPTYQSKYPPAQGLILAIGQLIWHPILGVWLSAGFMIVAIYWMLRGFLNPSWALIGSILALFQLLIKADFVSFDIFMAGYWTQSYWGGTVAATGGAMFFGALPRLRNRPRYRDCLIMAFGIIILANSRPYEGFVMVSITALLIIIWLVRRTKEQHITKAIRRPILLACVVLAFAAGFITFYNYRVTGDPLKLPWLLYHEQYRITPGFIWQQPSNNIPEYRSPTLRFFHLAVEPPMLSRHKTYTGFFKQTKEKLVKLWWFFLGPILTIPFLLLPRVRNPWILSVGIVCAFVIISDLLTFNLSPHHTAPITSLIVLLITQGMRQLTTIKVDSYKAGVAVSFMIVIALLVQMLASLPSSSRKYSEFNNKHSPRLKCERSLKDKYGGQKLLVFVRYMPSHSVHSEWVYNKADIDSSGIVWAHDLGTELNNKLKEYFADRKSIKITVFD